MYSCVLFRSNASTEIIMSVVDKINTCDSCVDNNYNGQIDKLLYPLHTAQGSKVPIVYSKL